MNLDELIAIAQALKEKHGGQMEVKVHDDFGVSEVLEVRCVEKRADGKLRKRPYVLIV